VAHQGVAAPGDDQVNHVIQLQQVCAAQHSTAQHTTKGSRSDGQHHETMAHKWLGRLARPACMSNKGKTTMPPRQADSKTGHASVFKAYTSLLHLVAMPAA
jgi:hypothetical protein